MTRIGQQNLPLSALDEDILAAIDALGPTPEPEPDISAEFSSEPWNGSEIVLQASDSAMTPASEFHPLFTDEEAEEFNRLDDQETARKLKSQVAKDGLAKYARPYVEKAAKNHEIDQERKTPQGKVRRAAQEKKRYHEKAAKEGRVVKTRNRNPTPEQKKKQGAARSKKYRDRQKEAAQLSAHPDEASEAT